MLLTICQEQPPHTEAGKAQPILTHKQQTKESWKGDEQVDTLKRTQNKQLTM